MTGTACSAARVPLHIERCLDGIHLLDWPRTGGDVHKLIFQGDSGAGATSR
jgi:hypothetical protein